MTIRLVVKCASLTDSFRNKHINQLDDSNVLDDTVVLLVFPSIASKLINSKYCIFAM